MKRDESDPDGSRWNIRSANGTCSQGLFGFVDWNALEMSIEISQ